MSAEPRYFPAVIREMRQTDLATVAGIERSAYEFPWSPGIFRDCLLAGYTSLVLEQGAAVIGYGIMSVAAGEAHLLNLALDAVGTWPGTRPAAAGRTCWILPRVPVSKVCTLRCDRATARRSRSITRPDSRRSVDDAPITGRSAVPKTRWCWCGVCGRGAESCMQACRPINARSIGSGRTPLWRNRPVLAWAFYDWANSAFSLLVVTVFVPLMLGGFWNDGAASPLTTFRLGVGNGIASAVVVLLAPLLGAMTDRAGRRKPWLAAFTGLGVLATAGLAAVGPGGWLLALVCFVLGSIGFFAANSLYDALLIDVAHRQAYDRVSALGYALGYLGSALLFVLSIAMLAQPERFGFASAVESIRLSFLMVAVWWADFQRCRCCSGCASSARIAHPFPAQPACRFPPAVQHLAGGAQPAAAAALSAGLLAVHRRRLHDHQDGGGLRPVAGAVIHRRHRRDPAHQLHRFSGRDRLSACWASVSVPAVASTWRW